MQLLITWQKKEALSLSWIKRKVLETVVLHEMAAESEQSGRDPRELPLAMYAVEHLWPHLSEELGINIEYHKEGNLRLGKTEHHMEILQGLTDRQWPVVWCEND